jgi:hypothetical protein
LFENEISLDSIFVKALEERSGKVPVKKKLEALFDFWPKSFGLKISSLSVPLNEAKSFNRISS